MEVSIWSCWLRKRWAAARTIGSEPPTFTTATAFTRIVMASFVCAVACTLSWRLRSESLKYASMIGLTKTRDPNTTRWPAFSSTRRRGRRAARPPLPRGDDDRLVGLGDLDAAQEHDQDDQQDQGDRPDEDDVGHDVREGQQHAPSMTGAQIAAPTSN